MNRQLLLLLLSVLACVSLNTSQAVAQTRHYVDNLGDCDAQQPCHVTIMDAIEAASPSDLIEVFPGVYDEAVVFLQGKDNIVLKARTKWLMPVITTPADPNDPYRRGVTLYAPGVQVMNFVIESGVLLIGPGSFRAVVQGNRIKSFGIGFIHCTNSTVKDNWVLDGGIGVNQNSSKCVIEGNTVARGIGLVGAGYWSDHNVVRRNTVRAGGIQILGESYFNTVESNQVEAGSIILSGSGGGIDGNIVRQNVVRGGGIELSIGYPDFVLGNNTIESNFISGSPGDGIAINARGGACLIRRNTSVDNAGCDINDSALSSYHYPNTWRDNRFETACGDATESRAK